MAMQRMPGCNNQWLAHPILSNGPPAFVSLLLDSAADRIAMIGQFTHQDGVTKTVDGVEFLLGAVSKANGSTLQVSLQNVDETNGPVLREDGTPDQILTIANADAGFVTNAWYGGDFDSGATRSLAIGEMVAVVFQFGTFVAGDTVNTRQIQLATATTNQYGISVNLTGSVAIQNYISNVVLRCSDGTFGTIEHCWPCKAVNSHVFNVGTAVADEYALGVQWPFPYQTNNINAMAILAGPTFATELILYSGTTALKTVTIDHNALVSNATGRPVFATYPEQNHIANTLYRIGIRPIGTTSITVYSTDVNEVGHMACLPGGAECHLWTRLDQGAWGGEVTTRRLWGGIRISGFDDGAQAGGFRFSTMVMQAVMHASRY